MPDLKSTIIISVYRDDIALNRILQSLNAQSVSNFEIIVSEDGESEQIRNYLASCPHTRINIHHLTQKDNGFRKNRALNRAIQHANTDHLIFIDGDCVPHPEFIRAHQQFEKEGIACSGRRVELGERFSAAIRRDYSALGQLTRNISLLLHWISLYRDHAKNIESGIYSKLLLGLTRNRKTRLLGCNFSCNKKDLLKINGFNEDYVFPGTGEDTDVDWRLRRVGVRLVNIKFSAIQYHLYHKKTYAKSDINRQILRKARDADQYICINGINKPGTDT